MSPRIAVGAAELAGPPPPAWPVAGIEAEITRVTGHKLFRKSEVLRKLLSLLVEAELRREVLTETGLAVALLGLAKDSFHPYTNSNVRVHTSQLRKRLADYYRENPGAAVRLQLPVGSFRLRIEHQEQNPREQQWRRALGQAKLLAGSRYIDELGKALDRIDEVLALKPGFGAAYAMKASVHMTIASHGGAPSVELPRAREAAERALELAPEAWEAQAAAGQVAGLLEWDWARAFEHYGRAKALAGNEVAADPWYQATMVATGNIAGCLEEMGRALAEFPVPPRGLQQNYGVLLQLLERWEDAERELRQTAEIYPDDFSPWLWLAAQELVLGNRAKCVYYLTRAAFLARGRMPGALIEAGKSFVLGGRASIEGAAEGGGVEVVNLYEAFAWQRAEAGVAALKRMVEVRNPIAGVYLRSPVQRYLYGMPEFMGLFDRMGVARPKS